MTIGVKPRNFVGVTIFLSSRTQRSEDAGSRERESRLDMAHKLSRVPARGKDCESGDYESTATTKPAQIFERFFVISLSN